MFHSILAPQKIFVKNVKFFEENVTTWTPKTFKKAIYINCMNDIIVESQ